MIAKYTSLIEQWAYASGLDSAAPAMLMLKLSDEYGELCQGMVNDNQHQARDSIGDIYVLLTILSLQLGLDIESCIGMACDDIKESELLNGIIQSNSISAGSESAVS